MSRQPSSQGSVRNRTSNTENDEIAIVIKPAKLGDESESVYCPSCGNEVKEGADIHEIPSSLRVSDGLEQYARNELKLSVWGYRCRRHRIPHILLLPVSHAPTGYESLQLEIGGGFTAATPKGDGR